MMGEDSHKNKYLGANMFKEVKPCLLKGGFEKNGILYGQ